MSEDIIKSEVDTEEEVVYDKFIGREFGCTVVVKDNNDQLFIF